VSGGQPAIGAAATVSPRPPLSHYWLATLAALCCSLPNATLIAQTAYRYRDASGQWVFTDRAANASVPGKTFNLGHENGALHLAVERTDTADSTQLTAINDCLCVVTFQVVIVQSDFATIANGTRYAATVAPGTRQSLARAASTGTDKAVLRFAWKAALGSPAAVHNPPRPYRVPFAIGST
jgi:hypothetical protein